MSSGLRRWMPRLIGLNIGFGLLLLALQRLIPSMGDEESDTIGLSTIMNGRKLVSRSEAFRGGTALTIAGGTVIDLRSATLAPEGAHLRLRTVMGGTTLVVPRGWRVEVSGPALMGGIGCKTEADDLPDDAPTLVVEALAIMGGIGIGQKPAIEAEDIHAIATDELEFAGGK